MKILIRIILGLLLMNFEKIKKKKIKIKESTIKKINFFNLKINKNYI